MIVVKLTQEQAKKLKGIEVVKDNYFNPILDADNNYIVSLEEVEQCDVEWIKALPRIKYNPIKNNLLK